MLWLALVLSLEQELGFIFFNITGKYDFWVAFICATVIRIGNIKEAMTIPVINSLLNLLFIVLCLIVILNISPTNRIVSTKYYTTNFIRNIQINRGTFCPDSRFQ